CSLCSGTADAAFLLWLGDRRRLPSFPTRRSSDLGAKRIQEVLGGYQDGVIAMGHLEAAAARTKDPAEAFTLGALYGKERCQAESARDLLATTWSPTLGPSFGAGLGGPGLCGLGIGPGRVAFQGGHRAVGQMRRPELRLAQARVVRHLPPHLLAQALDEFGDDLAVGAHDGRDALVDQGEQP